MDSVPEISLAIIVGPPPEELSHFERLDWEEFERPIFGAGSNTLLASLKTARSLGCTHALCIADGDGAGADDFALLTDSARHNPAAIILGYRSAAAPARLWGRLSDLLMRLETGLRLRDTRGPRVYPLRLLDVVPTNRPSLTHMEMLVRAAWAKCPIIEIPLQIYTERRPHTSLLREWLVHIRLVARALSGWPHPKCDAAMASPSHPSIWRSVLQWFNPLRAWRELRQGGATRSEIAAGVAAGVFIANTPAWGFHTILALYVAKRLHLHPLAVVAGSHASAPPMGPFLVASAMWLGHVILHQQIPVWRNVTPFHGHFPARALVLLLDWLLGAAIIGTTLAIVVFIVLNFLFRFFERREGDSGSARNKPVSNES